MSIKRPESIRIPQIITSRDLSDMVKCHICLAAWRRWRSPHYKPAKVCVRCARDRWLNIQRARWFGGEPFLPLH